MGVMHASDQHLYNDIVQSVHGGYVFQSIWSVEFTEAVTRSPGFQSRYCCLYDWRFVYYYVVYHKLGGVCSTAHHASARPWPPLYSFILSVFAYGVLTALAEAFLAASVRERAVWVEPVARSLDGAQRNPGFVGRQRRSRTVTVMQATPRRRAAKYPGLRLIGMEAIWRIEGSKFAT